MIHINFNTWYVYYMDNNGQKQIIKQNLGYNSAVKFWQQVNHIYNFCEYASK